MTDSYYTVLGNFLCVLHKTLQYINGGNMGPNTDNSDSCIQIQMLLYTDRPTVQYTGKQKLYCEWLTVPLQKRNTSNSISLCKQHTINRYDIIISTALYHSPSYNVAANNYLQTVH